MPTKKTTPKFTPSEQADEFYAAAAETVKKAAADELEAPVFVDAYDEAFHSVQPCTVHEFAAAVKRPAAHCRTWLTEQAAAGRVERDGDLKWRHV
jgi:hypothetical protein